MNAIELGATLYVPATRSDVAALARGSNPELRSMVICLEDSIRDDQVEDATAAFAATLLDLQAQSPAIITYARPRNIEMLSWMLRQPGIESIKGFVLPKITALTLPHWLALLGHEEHHFMPTIESEEAFDRVALARLSDQLLSHSERVTAIRIGGNDILNVLGVRRSRHRTAYDGPLAQVIRDIANTFIPNGISVAAPVFEHYSDLDLLRREVEQDIEHGLLTKTAIHPMQIKVIHDCYQPSNEEIIEARHILDKEAKAVFGSSGSMCEPATHRRWAGNVINRAQAFGLRAPSLQETTLVA